MAQAILRAVSGGLGYWIGFSPRGAGESHRLDGRAGDCGAIEHAGDAGPPITSSNRRFYRADRGLCRGGLDDRNRALVRLARGAVVGPHHSQFPWRRPIPHAALSRCAVLWLGDFWDRRGDSSGFCVDTVQPMAADRQHARNDAPGPAGNIPIIYEQAAGGTAGQFATASYGYSTTGVAGDPGNGLRPASFCATWHATQCPGLISRSGGISTLQMSIALGQRG